MTNYELTIVLPGGFTKAKIKKTKEFVEKVISTFEGKIAKTDDWGNIDLAYPIKNDLTGNFVHFVLELEEERTKELDNKLRLEDDIVRYLLVKTEK